MSLFRINRHDKNAPEPTEYEEQHNIAKVHKRIKNNKQLRNKQKGHEDIEHKIKLNDLEPQLEDIFIDTDVNKPATVFRKRKKDSHIQNAHHSEIGEFTFVGDVCSNKNKIRVKRVLPNWFCKPEIISVNLQNLCSKVSDMKELDSDLRKQLKCNGIKYFFPVQATVIPWLLQSNIHSDVVTRRDICVSAPTGSGKTLAFVLPVIQALKPYSVKRIRALVILPTQDLAHQVYRSFKNYSVNTNLEVGLITGNSPLKVEQKQLVIENEVYDCRGKIDILVCTAGRLVDHLTATKGFSLEYLEFIVIDEADRVLDNVQNDWLHHLEEHFHQKEYDHGASKILDILTFGKWKPPQKLLFSATLSQDPEKLKKLSLCQPKLFTSVVEGIDANSESVETQNTAVFIGKYTTPKELTEKYITCATDLKPLVVYQFLKKQNFTKTIIFTHSVESTHRLTILLRFLFKKTSKIEEVSTNLQPSQRNVLIGQFSQGITNIIVSTDRLARGIDFAGVQCVISYSAPKYIKTYIHRVGRTARAGEHGIALTLLEKPQINSFLSLLHQAGKMNLEEIIIPEQDLSSAVTIYEESLNNLKKTINKEEEQNLKKIKLTKRAIQAKRTKLSLL